MNNQRSLYWFRRDLRLADNPGLLEAASSGKIFAIYIEDDSCPKEFSVGSASKVWLHHSLQQLQQALGNNLNLYQGTPQTIIPQLAQKYKLETVFWSCGYDPWRIQQEKQLKTILAELDIHYQSYNSSYLWSPKDILKDDGNYYKVFAAYKRKASLLIPRAPLLKPKNLLLIKDEDNKMTIGDFHFISQQPWENKISSQWEMGEAAAQRKLSTFIEENLSGYKKGRDYPSQEHSSKLSPHLHFGELSPYQVWEAVNKLGWLHAASEDVEHFFNELIWREFSCYLLYYFPTLYKDNFQKKFDIFPWRSNMSTLYAWQRGQTGFPIIDAGMRQLWQTGYMHNRVRMIVASFLTKNLALHWQKGQQWFADCLVDADLANNSASWQWVAGSGVDAAPYFRIFNPITQSEKFDSEGAYIKKYLPELSYLPLKYLFKPWEAPEKILQQAGIILGKNYPNPIVDLKLSRDHALSAYKNIK